jgi:hypothetical protein
MYKFRKAIPCKNLVTLLENMLANRRYQVFMRCKGSKWHTAKNGLLQVQ